MTAPIPDPVLRDALQRQRDGWAAGACPLVEEVLRDAPALAADGEAILDLVYQERLLREAAGQDATWQEYAARFPHLVDPLRRQFEIDALLTAEASAAADDGHATLPFTERIAPASPPVEVPGCTVLDELGRGAMGVVYRGWQQATQRPVAIKVLFADVPASRVRTEARAAARLHHPHIVTVYDVRENHGQTVLVLEYVEGGTLADKLAGRPQPPRDAGRLVEQLAWAMAYAHQRGVVHRDLKPSNILLAGGPHAPLAQCVPKIGDFGLAKLTEGGEAQTRTRDILGTPGYMAPEQAGSGEPVGPSCDVYALGAILYEALTGRAPFLGASLLQTLEQVRGQEPIPPARLQPTVPHDLEVICLTCLHKSPAHRYAGARELAEELRHWLAGEPIQARPAGAAERAWKWRRRHPVAAALATVGVVLTIAALAGGLTLNGLLRDQRDRAREQAAQLDDQLQQTRQLLYTAGLLRVGAIWEADPVQGLRLLDDPQVCPPDLRCLSWRILHAGCQRYTHQLAASSGVTALACRPGTAEFAAATDDGQVTVWDSTGQRRQQLTAEGRITALAFTRDGGLLAAGGSAGKVHVWEMRSGQLQAEQAPFVRSPADGAAPVAGLAWLPDGRTLLISGGAGKAGAILFWDARAGRVRRTLREATHPLSGVAISPEGDTLAGGGPDSSVRLWDARTGRLRKSLPGHTAPVRCLQFTANGRLLVTGGLDGQVRLWDPARESAAGLIEPDLGPVVALALHPDGHEAAVVGEGSSGEGGESGSVLLCDLVNRRVTEELRGHAGAAAGLGYSADGRTLLSAGADQTVKVWPHPPRRDQLVLRGHVGTTGSVALSADGRVLAWAATTDPASRTATQIHVLDLAQAPAPSPLRAHGRPVQCLALSSDGRLLAAGFGHPGEPSEVRLWEVSSGRLIQAWGADRWPLAGLAFDRDGTALLTAEVDGTIHLWDIASGKPRARLSSPVTPIHRIAWNRATGQVVAAAGEAGTILVWDEVGGAPSWRLDTRLRLPVFALSHDGRRLALAAPGGAVRLVAVTGEPADALLPIGLKQVGALAFSPDDRTLAIAGDGVAVKLWDVSTLQERASLPGHRGGVCFLAFGDPGMTLLAATRTQTARLWRPAPR